MNMPTPEMYMKRATLASLYINIVLVLIKMSALVFVNSLAIAIDLGISFAGLMVSFILYYSIRLASRPADMAHNYGYGKVEHVCEALEGIVLIGIAVAMSLQSFVKLLHPDEVKLPLVGMLVSMSCSGLNFAGAYYIFKMSVKSGSPAIKAEALHWRMEGFISASISAAFIVSMELTYLSFSDLAHYVDPLAALVVSVLIVFPSFKLAKEAFFKLLDSSVEEESQMEILRHLGRHIHSYCEFGNIRTRVAGRKKFVEISVIMPHDMSLRQSHRMLLRLKNDLERAVENSDVTIHMVPCGKDCDFSARGEMCPYMRLPDSLF